MPHHAVAIILLFLGLTLPVAAHARITRIVSMKDYSVRRCRNVMAATQTTSRKSKPLPPNW